VSWIERVAENVATFEQIVFLTQLFAPSLGVVVTLAQRGELIERRECLTAGTDRGAMVDRDRGFDAADLQTGFAKRVLAQLLPS